MEVMLVYNEVEHMPLDTHMMDYRGPNGRIMIARTKVLTDALSVIHTDGETYLSNLIKSLSQNEDLELFSVLNREASHRYSYLSDRMIVISSVQTITSPSRCRKGNAHIALKPVV